MYVAFSLRHLGSFLFILLITAASCNMGGKDKELICIVGTYTENTESKGIYTYAINMNSKQAVPLHHTSEMIVNPSYICIDRLQKNAYAVSETNSFLGKESGSIAHYKIESDWSLSLVNKVPSAGTSPCYLSLTKNTNQLLVANYASGTDALFKVYKSNGIITNLYSSHQVSGSGPDSIRQLSPHAHYIQESPHHPSIAYALDLGADKIITYRLDDNQLNVIHQKHCAAGSGPRHMAFHPSLPLCYVINELKSSITTYAIKSDATLDSIQELSTIPTNYLTANLPSGIVVHPSGKMLYALNRGQDAIAIFHINQEEGTLIFHRYVSTLGHWPRSATVYPNGHLLFIANQKSNNIIIYGIDSQSGEILEDDVMQIAIPAPSHVALLEK